MKKLLDLLLENVLTVLCKVSRCIFNYWKAQRENTERSKINYNMSMIAYVYDEQILASVFCIKGWRRFAPSFLTTAYIHCQGLLHANNMIWLREADKAFENLSKKYPSIFVVKNGILEIARSQEEIYEIFVKSYPAEFQVTLSTLTKVICGEK